MEITMNGVDDFSAENLESSVRYENRHLKGHFDADDSGMTESKSNYIISPTFSAYSNRAFVGDDEGADDALSIYAVLDGGSRGQGVASTSSAQPHGQPSEPIIKYVNGTADYEAMPRASGILDEMFGYTHIDDGTVVVGTGPFYRSGEAVIPDGKQHLVSTKNGINGKARRRSNPLYDFPVARFPGGCSPQSNQGPCGQSGLCCAFQTLVFLVAVGALVLAIISVVIGLSRGQEQSVDRKEFEELVKAYRDLVSNYSVLHQLMQNDLDRNDSSFWSPSSDYNFIVQKLLRKNSELQKTIDDLQVKVQSLETVVSLQSGVTQNLTSQVDSQTKQIGLFDTTAANITNAVDNLKKDLSYQISKVPQGLVNLTSCVHRFLTYGTSARQLLTSTNPLNLNDSIVLSVVCSTEGGTQALLRFDRNSPDVYSCECSGQMNSSVVSRYCYIHYWTCPIVP